MLHQGKKRVIVFLIYADFRIDLTEKNSSDLGADRFSMNIEAKIELDLMLKEIMTTPINPQNAQVYVIFNGIRYMVKARRKPRVETKTLFYEIINPNNAPSNEFGKFEVIDSRLLRTNSTNTGTLQAKNKLTAILKKVKVTPNEDVTLITWDHGSAFGIFRDVNPGITKAQIKKPIDNQLKDFPYLNALWQLALKEDKKFEEFIKEEKKKTPIHIIQAGNKFYTLAPEYNEDLKLKKFLGNDQLSELWEIKKNNGLVPMLYFDSTKYAELNFTGQDPELIEIASKGLKIEQKIPEILGNKELADSIKGWLKTKKVGVLLMMNCWMMNLHTMYAMKPVVECLVAPQGTIAIPGYNYRDILRYIYKPKTFYRSNQKLAKKMVQTCENKFALKRAENIYRKLIDQTHPKIDFWKIIAIDLQKKIDKAFLFDKQIDALKLMIKALIADLDDNDPARKPRKAELKYLLKYIRSVCYDFSRNVSKMIDIVNWSLSVVYGNSLFIDQNEVIPQLTKKSIAEFTNQIIVSKANPSTLVLEMTKGESIYYTEHPANPTTFINLPPTGYSLFFPLNDFAEDEQNLKQNVESDFFLHKFLLDWKSFLKKTIDPNIKF